jgi:hypothetical protein
MPTDRLLDRGSSTGHGPDQILRGIMSDSVALLLDSVGPDTVESVILTGSVARGEASLLPTPDGFRLLGDVEFMVIYRPTDDWSAVRRRAEELGRRATEEIGEGGRRAVIEFGAGSLEYLRRNIRPAIFSYDLVRHGKVVWGRPDILAEVAPFDTADIPPEDAVALVMNRIVELMAVRDAMRRPGNTVDTGYHVVKVILDLAGAALAFTGRYVSSYGARRAAFESLLHAMADLRSTLPEPMRFVHDLSRAIDAKREPTPERLAGLADAATVARVTAWSKALWLWQMRRLLRRPSGRFPELLDGYLARERFATRIRQWAKFALHPFRPQGAFAPARAARLLFQGSPHALTYASAMLVYWSRTGDGGAPYLWRAGDLLPVRRRRGPATAHEVANVWRWLIRNN